MPTCPRKSKANHSLNIRILLSQSIRNWKPSDPSLSSDARRDGTVPGPMARISTPALSKLLETGRRFRSCSTQCNQPNPWYRTTSAGLPLKSRWKSTDSLSAVFNTQLRRVCGCQKEALASWGDPGLVARCFGSTSSLPLAVSCWSSLSNPRAWQVSVAAASVLPARL